MASSSGTKDVGSTVEAGDENTVVDSEILPSSLDFIAPILRVAHEIEQENPRVAHLCRFHAFYKAHRMDPTSSGQGVLQFKTYLLHRLEKEESETAHLLAKDDRREIQKYYQNFCEKNIREGQHTKKPEEIAKIYQIATVLYDVLMTVVPSSKIDHETQRYAKDVKEKKVQYEHYNILPLYAVGVEPEIMKLPEIIAALRAIRNVEGLPSFLLPKEKESPVHDILEWLAVIFGFQKGNVANQREHLILLLANMDVRKKNPHSYEQLDDETIKELTDKIFKNYQSWCKYLHFDPILWFPRNNRGQQAQLLHIGLYLLIWGEASNIRFMPECICFIFHHMAKEMHGYLFGNAQQVSEDHLKG